MRLEPVQLVAPEPSPSPMASRRAFLIAGGTFFAGLGLGGRLASGAGSVAEEPHALPLPEDDQLLAELRELATDRSMEELIESRLTLLHFVRSRYRDDALLMRGVERLARACITLPEFPDRFVSSRSIASAIDASRAASPSLREVASQLRALR